MAVVIVAIAGVSIPPASAAAAMTTPLPVKYRQHQERLPSLPAPPVSVTLANRDGRLNGHISLELDQPHALVTDMLRRGSAWCEVAPLHLNVKACTHQTRDGATRLSFYGGRRHYQPPESARRHVYDIRVLSHNPDYFRAVLTPDPANADARHNRITVESFPLGNGRTFVHIEYSLRFSAWMRLAANGYFATLGRNKIGFSSAGTDRNGRPVPVRGLAGALERNAVRYYLALQTYFHTRDTPAAGRLERQLGHWFDLTEQYAAQLREMDRADYLSAKRRERVHQARLQAAIDATATLTPAGR
jgi:hypothetical protein